MGSLANKGFYLGLDIETYQGRTFYGYWLIFALDVYLSNGGENQRKQRLI